MNNVRLPSSHFFKFFAVVILIAASTFGVGGQRHRASLSSDLLSFEGRLSASRTRVIVRGSRADVEAMALRHGLAVARWLDGAAVLLANSKQVSDLAADSANEVLSGDAVVAPFMDVSDASTAADQVRAGLGGGLLGLGGISSVNGTGVTVAVIDTGIADHPALYQKVIASVSKVTGDPSTNDAHGHGTHIAGIIAGSGASSVTAGFRGGIAPGVKLVNVRVLGADGTGYTSDVIAGIEWVIENRDKYKIRAINLSLGHPVTEPSTTDPLCQAVMKASMSGIIVIASAGNAGKAEDGSPILGGISSPGNSPYAITVGALNTRGTPDRSDDIMATYSSRGPTRFENVVKPDVVAPGNKIISLEARGSYLPRTYPQFHVAGTSTNRYMHLSGTSMSAAVVTGGAALLMQAHPKITSAQLKMALQSGATYMVDGGLMGGGAGSVNFWSSRKMASSGLTNIVSTLVGGVLTPASGVMFWDAGTMSTRLYRGYGLRVLSLLEAPLAWLSGGYLRWDELNLIGLSNPLSQVGPNEILWGDVSRWTADQEILWGDTIYSPEGQEILWGDSRTTEGDEILWGDSLRQAADQ